MLAALYEATDGPNWAHADNWMTDAPLWEWYGVYTDGSGRVGNLWLHDNDLRGRIPREFGELANLEWLYLNDNDLTGSLPPELGQMSSLLILDVANNAGLSGPLPPELTILRLWSLAVGARISAHLPARTSRFGLT